MTATVDDRCRVGGSAMTMTFAPAEGVDMGEVESALDRLAELAQTRTTALAQGVGGRDQRSRTGQDTGHRKTSAHGGTSDSTPSTRGLVRFNPQIGVAL